MAYSEIKLPDKVKSLPRFCFYNCKNLKSVQANGIEDIKDYAFKGSSLTEINLPSTLRRVGNFAFSDSEIRSANFMGKYPPEVYKSNMSSNNKHYDIYEIPTSYEKLDGADQVKFTVPKGCLKSFKIGVWKNLSIKETTSTSATIGESTKKSTKSEETGRYTFDVKKPGTLAVKLTDKIAPNVESLTIRGFLYDTDFSAIRKCTNLRELDISHCFTSKSPETIKKEDEKAKFELALIGSIARAAQQEEQKKADKGKGINSQLRADYSGTVAKVFETAMKNYDALKVDADENCYLDWDAFNGLRFLEKIAFPIQLKTLCIGLESTIIREMILPPYLEEIRQFYTHSLSYLDYDLKFLKEVKFPRTLKKIGERCFRNCGLETVDLSNTMVEEIGDRAFEHCENLKVFKGSRYMKECGPNAFNMNKGKTIIGYFYTPENTNGIFLNEFKEAHLIRGTKAGWRTMMANVIDDIEE